MPFYMLHPKEVESTRRYKNAIVVDVRERAEYQSWHYPNAVCMPYCEGEKWLNHFRRGQNYILYCDYGNISLLAARELAQKGVGAYTVVGGAKALKREMHF